MSAAALLALPAIALAKPVSRRPPAISLSFDRVGSFTPATADPKLAAAFGNRSTALGDFKFTPAAPKGRPSQVRVAIRARAATGARSADAMASTVGLVTPASYNLGVSVGWRRFAVTGDVAKVGAVGLAAGGRDTAVVGVNYSLNRRITGRVAALAERSDGTQAPALGRDKAYALDVGGAYALSRNVAVTGGVRYKVDRERASNFKDDRRDSQAVYVGTAFKF
ncbi:MAG: outer membrane beta-barrel protein [Sphingomicrobium sp.]